MVVINYSSYAHVIEKGMNKRNMTGMAKMLFAFISKHTNVVYRRITKKDIEDGNTDLRSIAEVGRRSFHSIALYQVKDNAFLAHNPVSEFLRAGLSVFTSVFRRRV